MKHRQNMRTFKLGGKLKVKAKMCDAKEAVDLPLTREHIINGVPGSPWLCVGGQCMMGNGKLFPFLAEAVQFTKSRAYVIGRSSSRTNVFRSLRYEHGYRDFVDLFDKFNKMTSEEKSAGSRPCLTVRWCFTSRRQAISKARIRSAMVVGLDPRRIATALRPADQQVVCQSRAVQRPALLPGMNSKASRNLPN